MSINLNSGRSTVSSLSQEAQLSLSESSSKNENRRLVNVDKEYGRRTHVDINVKLDFILFIFGVILGSCDSKNEFRSGPAACADCCEKRGITYLFRI